MGDAKRKYGNLANKDYLERCLKSTPTQRFDAMISMMEFMNEAMTPETKRKARLLREKF